jgi:predicted RNA binding protein YcfA (HicA-like mRNA interferase family)
VKRRELIKQLENKGWWLLRNGAKHDIYTNGKKIEPIPRHPEIDELLAKAIIKRQGLK